MTKRAILYVRVSTDEQAEHGYSLQSQLEACRAYAERLGFIVVAEISDDYSGAKLARPGLDELRAMIDRREADAVIVFSPDRLTRNLAHSLILREEWQRAGIELHYCNRGKSENTPESQMTENIEAVFGDYWRAKIIESSARGRRTKAANGKWPCDGHAPYGYRKEGKAREAHLEIDESEAAVIRRIFALYIGADGRPMPLQTIAATLTAEKVPPPNRGTGAKHPGKGWHRGVVRTILARCSYIGEFRYGGHTLHLPELAIIDAETFTLAGKRRNKSRAAAVNQRKYDFLLAGHFRCTCGLSMVTKPTFRGKWLYYACSSEGNKRHMRGCQEKQVRADVADPVVWEWVVGWLCDESKLDKGLQELAERQDTELQPKRERLALIDELIAEAERKIKRLASAFAEEHDELIAATLRGEMKAAGRAREGLIAERETLQADLTQGKVTETERAAIQALATEIRQRLADPSFEKKRELMNLLDVRVKLERQGGIRGVRVTCALKPNPTPSETQTEDSNGEWLSIPALGRKSLSTTTT